MWKNIFLERQRFPGGEEEGGRDEGGRQWAESCLLPISCTGCLTPISLFTVMMDTREVSGLMAASSSCRQNKSSKAEDERWREGGREEGREEGREKRGRE